MKASYCTSKGVYICLNNNISYNNSRPFGYFGYFDIHISYFICDTIDA